MTSTVRRAGAFALVGTLALVAPAVTARGGTHVAGLAGAVGVDVVTVATVAATAPFVAVAALALTVVDEGPLFDLFARPGDRQDGTLYGLTGFALAAAGLALLSVRFGLPGWVFVGSVFALGVGNVGGNAVDAATGEAVTATAGFVLAGFLGSLGGQLLAVRIAGYPMDGAVLALLAFLAASGALLGALLRSVLFERDDPLVMVSIALLLWLLADLSVETATPDAVVVAAGVTTTRIAVALGVTLLFGYVAYALETASVPGMVTGVFLGLQAIVLGGYGWFVVLLAFFGLGGLSTKFRYDEKAERGIAEPNEGARGSGNVLANSLVALVALLAWAASPSLTTVARTPFLFAFAGSVAAATSDTFSSEIGGLFDEPRLITTFEVVEPGTDGAVTWQGELAGVAGSALIAGLSVALFEPASLVGGAVVFVAGLAGMTVDSILGATIEGWVVDNQGVNLLATAAAAVVAVALWLAGVP